MRVPEPREPLSVGAVVVWTIINPVFGLIALAVRNSVIRANEPRVARKEPSRVWGYLVLIGVVIWVLVKEVPTWGH